MEDNTFYDEDVEQYIQLKKRFMALHEDDGKTAYFLMKDSLIIYDRWSYIRSEFRKGLKRGEKAELKDRMEEITKTIYEIYTVARMVWKQAKDTSKLQRED